MCAINPVHKKRIILDVYTSDKRFTQETFNDLVIETSIMIELHLNTTTSLRWHIKETNQEAD